nr:M15 family metallopeptidase [uncultured Deefgea sp.]
MKQAVFALGLFFSPVIYAESLALTAADCIQLQANGVITIGNPVPCERLRRVDFPHYDLNGQKRTGQLIVLDVVAPQVESLMATLWQAKFPIHSALGMEQFQGNDESSMNANNSSAFNGRPTTGGKSWSKHAYGVAIDINPLQNPYVNIADDGGIKVLPQASAKVFLNRLALRPEKPQRIGLADERIADLFAQHGFLTWGGDWDKPIDYQHFEIGSRTYINELIKLPLDLAQANFNQYAASYRQCAKSEVGSLSEVRARCIAKVRK